MAIPAIILGILCVIVAIWIGFPMTGIEIMSTVWLRATLIGVIVGIILIVQVVKWRKRRAAAKEIEDALTPDEPVGDGAVLSERMDDALATLKKSGGAAYLYDLPWYVIIGPPGAGKTTALRNSGIEFPLSNADDAGVVSGFGGTRYCDWWFAEDAILIDTAGRYTTQDSDKTADENSWQAFLDLLKKSRPNQPINGVILAFSVEDMMNANEDELARHSEIVRARLAEVHEKLRIDFPVYVLFTKCDLISGFREYFSSFSLNRRKNVWGVTFQTKDRKAQTHEQVPEEFDTLVSRLSDEIIDRLNEEPDGISRVAIFGLPGQMALLRDNVTDFLRRVFEPTRYQTSAILRGFYFTSGTQEGTPIDQVLGSMSQTAQAGMAPAFMSGQGKSFFLHDVLDKVIFAERDWVGHDAGAIRRAKILRILGLSGIGLATTALLGVLGFSFWQNKSLVDDAQAQAQSYAIDAQREIARIEIDDWDPLPILPYLERLRLMPAGYGNEADVSLWNGFGLRQVGRIKSSAQQSYADALETMLRPRLVLDVERRLPELRNQGDPAQIYRALKVYMLLAGQGPRPDDAAVTAWFDDVWDEAYGGAALFETREQLKTHLAAMLELDDTRDVSIPIDSQAVSLSRSEIVQMSLADQAYAIILDKARLSSLPEWSLVEVTAPQTSIVFSTSDGSDLADVTVDPLYTFDGYWFFFMDELINVRQVLEDDKWVLGEQADAVNFDQQMAGLDQALQRRYALDFEQAWTDMLVRIQLNNMSGDAPQYDALAAAAAPFASPIVRLANAVSDETKLTRFLDELAAVDPTALATGDVGADVGGQLFQRFKQTSGGLQRILLEAATNSAKNQRQVNSGGGGSAGPRREAERIEDRFILWHQVIDGPDTQRAIDIVLSNLSNIRDNRRLAVRTPAVQNQLLPGLLNDLTSNNSRLPPTIVGFINDAERDFQNQATDTSIAEMNREMRDTITSFCRTDIEGAFPFASGSRQVSIASFGRFFGPGGAMDKFYQENLSRHAIRTGEGLSIDPASPLADRLSANMLLQFERAQRIQRAFFGSGAPQPEVQIGLTPIDIHPDIQQLQIELNGINTFLEQNGNTQTVTWPGAASSTMMQALPGFVGVSPLRLQGGQWTIIPFIRGASSSQSIGNGARLTYIIGQRAVTFDMTFATGFNPFTMPELQSFSCPQTVD